MHASDKQHRGKYCGRTQTYLLRKPCTDDKRNSKAYWAASGKLELCLWLGLDENVKATQQKPYGGEVSVFAETVLLAIL